MAATAASVATPLQGSVVVVPLPAGCSRLGLVVHVEGPYLTVRSVETASPLNGQVQEGDKLLNLGQHNLLNVSAEGFTSIFQKEDNTSMVLLRPISSSPSARKSPRALGKRTRIKEESTPATADSTPGSSSKRRAVTVKQERPNSTNPVASHAVTVKREAGTGAQIECIELLSDDDEEEVEVANVKGNSSKTPADTKIEPPTIFAEGRARFPQTIDTGFNGNAQKVTALKFKATDLQRSTGNAIGLPFIWPNATPVPDYSGGFYEEYYSRPNAKKTASSKTQSRVARLAGQIKINVRVANPQVFEELRGLGNNHTKYVLAEDVIKVMWSGTVVSLKDQDTLVAIHNLNDRDNLFKERCLFVLAEAPALGSYTRGAVAQVNFRVYFRRALFGLAANPSLKRVLDALEPLPHQEAWTPCRQNPPSTDRYKQSQRPKAHGFDHSLPGVLWANESTGYPLSNVKEEDKKKPAYKGLKNVTLRDYQLESVAWMQSQENANPEETGGGVAGLNGYFWEQRSFADGENYHYFPFGGQLLMEPPPVVTGGLLAEEMGLGKTVITLELICSDAKKVPEGRGGTLVVLPVSLLVQWREEIETKAPHLQVLTYHEKQTVEEFHTFHRGNLEEAMSEFDVVLTTMSKLKELTSSRNRGHQRTIQKNNCLTKVEWHRLVIDECQFLKNDTTAIARAASAITAKHIWMLSGTPLTNKLDDLRGELSLLRVWPFTLGTSSDVGWRDWFWTEYCKKPWDDRSGDSLPIIQKLMRAVCMRHSRLQLRSDGSPLVELPPREEKFVAITMDSRSSYAFVTRWVEAVAGKLLHGFNRFDVRVTGLIMKLRQLASSPALLLDQSSLEQVDDALSEIANLSMANAPDLGIQKVSLVDAIKARRNEKDSPVLQELVIVAANGPSYLAPCTYCKGPRTRPACFPCNHSICVGCCEEMLKFNGCFGCPVCKKEIRVSDVSEVVVPEQLLNSTSRSRGAIEVDVDASKIDEVLVDDSLKPQAIETSTPSAPEQIFTTYNVSQEEKIDFQFRGNDQKAATFESLKQHPKPHLVSQLGLRSKEVVATLENREEMKALINHAAACNAELHCCPKIKALCDTIQSIRERSLEAKICVFSTFSRVLDQVETALNSVRYTVEYDMNGNMHLSSGQRVKCLSKNKIGFVVGKAREDHYYEVKTMGETTLIEHRDSLRVQPVVVENVPSKLVRTDMHDNKLSVNGSNDRHAVGSIVESKRPIVPSKELQVGYNVLILPTDEGRDPEPGRVVYVHHLEDGGVSFDVQPDGYVTVAGGDHARMEVRRGLPPGSLLDKGGGKWGKAKILGVSAKQRLSDATFTPSAGSADPFEHAIGFVRLDGSAGNASKRGDILEVFKHDPMTSVCLLTKEAAGVGLNLTDANHVIVLEPSMDAHDELQSIARVHRIGQTRKVSVLKFFVEGSLEERILLRRQQRGELSVAINSLKVDAGPAEDEKAKGKESKDAEVSSSRAMTFDDLKLLLCLGKEADLVDMTSGRADTEPNSS